MTTQVGHQVLGATIASALKIAAGAASFTSACSAWTTVHLRLVDARRAEPLPGERDGIEPEDVDAAIGKPQDRVEHGREDVRIRVVEVPLVRPERCPYPAAGSAVRLVEPGERAGRPVGKDRRDGALVGVRHGAVREGGVEVRVRRVAGEPAASPLVFLAVWLRTTSMHRLIPGRAEFGPIPRARPSCPAVGRSPDSPRPHGRHRSRRHVVSAPASGGEGDSARRDSRGGSAVRQASRRTGRRSRRNPPSARWYQC